MRKRICLLIFILLINSILVFSQTINLESRKAFPSAEGYGRNAGLGQIAKEVYYVTNLNDSGPGSLREAVSQSNRLVLFKVSGTIRLTSEIRTDANNLHIAGQTAFYNDGQGITLKSDGVQSRGLLWFTGDHIVIRFLRLRRGAGNLSGELSGDNINFYGSSFWIVDHCSVSWSTDENIAASDGTNGTMQYCISSEGLYFSTHGYTADPGNSAYQQGHSKGGIFGWSEQTPDKLTFYRNLFAHNDGRNPRIYGPGGTFEIVNNLMYNNRYFNIELDGENMNTNVVKNLLIPGKDTRIIRYMVHAKESRENKIFMLGNIGTHRKDNAQSEWDEVGSFGNPIGDQGRSFTSFETPLKSEFNSLTKASNLRDIVLNDVGAMLHPDDVDTRVINDVINLTPTIQKEITGTSNKWSGASLYYGIINDPSEVGGWPEIAPMLSTVQDINSDGIDDNWAAKHGVSNWYDVISQYTFDGKIILNNARYFARDIYLAYMAQDFDRLNNSPETSINNFESIDDQLTIFPNPVHNGKLTLGLVQGNYQIKLISLEGQVLKNQYFDGDQVKIDISSYPSGLYFVFVKDVTSDFSVVKKIIKK